MKVNNIGPSRVRALPLAAGINEGGHYFRYFSSSYLVVVNTAIQNHRRVVVGFQIFAWAPKKIKKNLGKKNY